MQVDGDRSFNRDVFSGMKNPGLVTSSEDDFCDFGVVKSGES